MCVCVYLRFASRCQGYKDINCKPLNKSMDDFKGFFNHFLLEPCSRKKDLFSQKKTQSYKLIKSFMIPYWPDRAKISRITILISLLCVCMHKFVFVSRVYLFQSKRAERHDFWPRLWLFSSSFLFPPKKEGSEKEN